MSGSIHVNTEPGAKTVFDTIWIPIEMFEKEGLGQIIYLIFQYLALLIIVGVGYSVISETKNHMK